MGAVATIGIDLAKNAIHIHGVDAQGTPVLRRKMPRREVGMVFANLPPCIVGLEAGLGAHNCARELIKLGHSVKLMPPQYVKPYVDQQK